MEITSQLVGKVAIVTGGSRGIGFSVASLLLSRGATVMVSSRNAESLNTARNLLATRSELANVDVGKRLKTKKTDIRNFDEVKQLFAETVDQCGGLDILINNAGVGSFSKVEEQTLEDWHQIIDTNLNGVFYCCREAVPLLRCRQGGWIINISSLAGKNPFIGGAAYCASKAGLNAFSEALMQEVRYDDIRVSCILPGSVDTSFLGVDKGNGETWKLSPEDVAKVTIDLISHNNRSLPSCVELRPTKPGSKKIIKKL